MRRFHARKSGALTEAGPWKGRVLSVHPRALNILRDDDLVVSVVADVMSMSAMGVLAPELFETLLNPDLAEAPASMEGSVLRVADLAAIDCTGSQAWEGTVEAAVVRALPPCLFKTIRESLFVHGNPAGLLGVLQPNGNVFAEHARAALDRGWLEELVGCGPGLTPSGDDFLTGVLLALPAFDSSRLKISLTGTAPAGRTLLWMAMQGRFPAYLAEFIRNVTGGSAEIVDAAVHSACSHGETSGTDALSGFCWAEPRSYR
jgi:hypothetical protein